MFARAMPSRFAVAFSFAGEVRSLVLPIAQEVEDILGPGTVYYDNWYLPFLAGHDAELELHEIYGDRCDLVVACVSAAYGQKPWTAAVEFRAVRARRFRAAGDLKQREQILLLRLGDGDVPGVAEVDIVPDVRDWTPAQVAQLVVARLHRLRGTAGGSGPVEGGWPAASPELAWPVADHDEVRRAFAALLVGSSEYRALFVRGDVGTGKSHACRQMVAGVAELDGMDCGRFDFRGGVDLTLEAEAFAAQLDVEPPPSGATREQLSAIFNALRRRGRPTTLIFDSYELAGDSAPWIETVLLRRLATESWLRVVVAGRRVPERSGSTWASIVAEPLTLEVPAWEEWAAYGRAIRNDIDVENDTVRNVHEWTRGDARTLASMFTVKQ